MKFLLKFVETDQYADDVMKGSIFMNPLYYFWRINYGEPGGASGESASTGIIRRLLHTDWK